MTRVGVDVGVFEAWLRGAAPAGLDLFERIEAGRLRATTSVLTLATLAAANPDAAEELGMLLPTFPHLDLVPVTLEVAARAAGYQARHGIDLSAAVQLATAKVHGADALVTTDPEMKRLSGELEVVLLDDLSTAS